MKIEKITGKTCRNARSLWEEVFSQDSKQFTDYYFEYKADKNIGYVIGEAPYDAMVFRTPYRMQIGEEQRVLSYLVGVATRKEHRHKGYMRQLLTKAMEEMYREKEPFTFLMPANPAIYEPFGFRYVYERENFELISTEESDGEQEIRESISDVNGIYAVTKLQKDYPEYPILEKLADFANKVLKEKYQIYVHRDALYYEMQLRELLAQNGDIFVLLQNGHIKAFYLYAKEEDEIFIQEVLEETEGILTCIHKKEETKPIIMARIIHLEEMLKLVECKQEQEWIVEVEDELIEENKGVFCWYFSPQGNTMKQLKEGTKADYKVSIQELSVLLIKNVFINELV